MPFFVNKKVILFQGDCLALMNDLPEKSVDMILCDLPYGVLNKTNQNAKWDSVIPFLLFGVIMKE